MLGELALLYDAPRSASVRFVKFFFIFIFFICELDEEYKYSDSFRLFLAIENTALVVLNFTLRTYRPCCSICRTNSVMKFDHLY